MTVSNKILAALLFKMLPVCRNDLGVYACFYGDVGRVPGSIPWSDGYVSLREHTVYTSYANNFKIIQ